MISCQSPRIIIFSQFVKSLKQNYTQISSKSNIFLSIYKWNCYINPSLLYLLSFLVSLKAYHCYHKPTQIRFCFVSFKFVCHHSLCINCFRNLVQFISLIVLSKRCFYRLRKLILFDFGFSFNKIAISIINSRRFNSVDNKLRFKFPGGSMPHSTFWALGNLAAKAVFTSLGTLTFFFSCEKPLITKTVQVKINNSFSY